MSIMDRGDRRSKAVDACSVNAAASLFGYVQRPIRRILGDLAICSAGFQLRFLEVRMESWRCFGCCDVERGRSVPDLASTPHPQSIHSTQEAGKTPLGASSLNRTAHGEGARAFQEPSALLGFRSCTWVVKTALPLAAAYCSSGGYAVKCGTLVAGRS